jgi:ATP-dependent DNA helicase RecQ
LRDWVHQLIAQGMLTQQGEEYPILCLNDLSWEVMRKQRSVRLFQAPRRREPAARSRADTVSWDGVDRGLFDRLRELRRDLAAERGLPPYVIFSDATLRELARRRPSTLEKMRSVYGIGERKLADFGRTFLDALVAYCRDLGLPLDVAVTAERARESAKKHREPTGKRARAWELFRDGAALEDVAYQTGRARSTVVDWLADFIRQERIETIAVWVAEGTYQQVADAARKTGLERLKPIHEALGGTIPYDEIRLVVAHLAVQASGQKSATEIP